jgi:ribonuclease T2
MRKTRSVALAAVTAGLLASPVSFVSRAVASDCILDNCADQRPMTPNRHSGADRYDQGFRRNGSGPRGSSTPGRFDFYVLSLSWSPGFCATGGDDKGRDQCKRGADIGFVVHGLWPQYDRGYPSDCSGSTRFPSQSALRETDGVYPDEGLAKYEWRKHGTCSGLSPNDYFAAAKNARDTVTIPPRFKDPHQAQDASPADVVRAFTDANPRLRPGMLAAICQHGTLDEVRICFDKDLKGFQACPEVVREGCRSGSVAIPAVR